VTGWRTVVAAEPTPTVNLMLTTVLAGAESAFSSPFGALAILAGAVVVVSGFIWLLVRMERDLPTDNRRVPHNTRARLGSRPPTSQEDTHDED
jgi:hypothetical protein